MKRSVIFSVLIVIILIAWGFYMWLNNEFIFENIRSLTPANTAEVSRNASSTGATSTEKRENIFEYGGGDSQKNAERKSQKPEIIYTTKGFDPAVLHVMADTSVTFFNKSGKAMKLASDAPDFPSPEEIQDGGSFSFTFKKKGYWSIADADNSSLVGVVSVE